MDTGSKISASAHALLIGGLLIGNPFRSEPLPMNVQEVSVITSEQFAAAFAPQAAPEVATDVALPQPADPEPQAVEPTVQAETAPVEPQPQPEQPEIEANEDTPVIVPPREDLAALTPEVAPEAAPQTADRVAPEAVEEPDPDATPAEETQEAITEAETGDVVEETQEATAPEAATTEIVTEADDPKPALTSSLRPKTRPRQLAARDPEPNAPETTPAQEDPPKDDLAESIAGAVASAQETPAQEAPTGPPLTGGEREGLKVAVASCWNVGALSSEAQETKVTVFVAMNRDGTPDRNSIRMLSSSGGTSASASRVFETARRAIIRCGARGFPLPVEKYGQWREIEMTFNPEGMFWR